MGRYVTTSEVSDFTGAPDNATLGAVIDGVESLFDMLIGSESGLITGNKTEYHPVEDKANNGRIFYLKTLLPTTITTVNWVSAGTLDTHYTLEGQKLEFKDYVASPTVFPFRYKIVYVSGYSSISTIPNEIKLALKQIVGAVWNSKQSQGMASFRQDLLSINYKDESILDILGTNERSHINTIINRYKVYSVI